MNDPRPAPTEGAGDVESLTLLGIIALLRRRKLFVLVPFVCFSAGGLAYALYLPNVFTASVIVALDVPAPANSRFDSRLTASGQQSTIREAINRRSFLEPMMAEFERYGAIDGQVSDLELSMMRSRLWTRVEGPTSFSFVLSDTDAQHATDFVTLVADRFVEETTATQQLRVQDQVERIEAEAASAEEELEDHERRIDSYRESAGGPIPENLQGVLSSLSRVTDGLRGMNRTIFGVEEDRAAAVEEMRQLEALGYDRLAPTPAAQNARRVELERQIIAARGRYTDQHPEVLRLQAALSQVIEPPPEDLDASDNGALAGPGTLRYRYIELAAELERIELRLDFYNDEKDVLVAELEGYQQQISAIPEHEQELSALMLAHERARTRYVDLLGLLQAARLDARLRSTAGPVGFRVIERARVPQRKSGPARWRIVMMGPLLGLFVGFGLLLARHQLDSSFSDVDDLRRFSSLSTLASIPSMRGGWFNRGPTVCIPTVTDTMSIASEQYRILTLRLRSMIDEECAQVLLVTSSSGSEGKTTTAVNAAVALSQIQPDKVLLVDADVRTPGVRQCFAEAAAGSAAVARQVRLGPREGLRQLVNNPNGLEPEYFGRVGALYFLSAEMGTSEPLDHIRSVSLRKSLAKLRKQFKYIIIDSPPLLPMVDSHVLAELADRVILIVRANQTRRETLARTLASMDLSKFLGFILNDVDYSRERYGEAYAYYAKEYLGATKGQRRAKTRTRSQ